MRIAPISLSLMLAGLLSVTGCAGLWRGTVRTLDVAPNGLPRADDALRRALIVGSYEVALEQTRTTSRGAPSDDLLRALYLGTASYYAGDFAQSIAAFAESDRLTEKRFTKSLSAGAVSLLTSDLALPYLPGRTERLFQRYYAMMSYAQMGNVESAAVEARRLGQLLEQSGPELHPAEMSLHAVMREAAGTVFEWAGEDNDALVSYRNAAVLRGATPSDVDSVRLTRASGDSATLVVFVESGFVAHRVDQSVLIPWNTANKDWDHDTLRNDAVFDDGERFWTTDAARNGNQRWLRVAWPSLRRSVMPTSHLTLAVDATQRTVSSDVGDVTLAVAEDLRRARPAMVLRMIARAGAKTAVVDALDGDNDWKGSIFSALGSGLERADTRSWQLLPGSIRMVRMRIPSGSHAPQLYVGDGFDRVTLRLPEVDSAPGGLTVMDARVWRDARAMVANRP